MEKYRICGLNIQCDFRYPTMQKRGEKYLCDFDGEADIVIPFCEEKIKSYHRKYPHLSESDCEVMLTTSLFYSRLLDFDGFMLHSSAVVVDGKAYLFSAASGTGKSTHTDLWLKLFGDRAYILNDDKPAICLIDGKLYACGSPWSGKSDLNRSEIVPLQGICMLERSENNFIEPLDESTAVYKLMNQTLRPPAPEYMDKLLSLMDVLLKNVPMWRMGCNISLEAAQTAYNAMSQNSEQI